MLPWDVNNVTIIMKITNCSATMGGREGCEGWDLTNLLHVLIHGQKKIINLLLPG